MLKRLSNNRKILLSFNRHFQPKPLKINSVITAVIAVTFLVSGACQRALHFETDTVSSGVLVKDNNGNCLPADITGTLMAGKSIADSIYLELELEIKVKGPFSIDTDTINGYYFKTNGDFTSTGRLKLSWKHLESRLLRD